MPALEALGQILFAYNLVQTMRGRRRETREPALASVGLTASLLLAAGVLAASAIALDQGDAGESATQPGLGAAGGTPTADAGEELFSSSCGSCHTLAAAGTTGTVGPDLDAASPSTPVVLQAIENGGAGSGTMPAGIFQGEEAQQVADYVAKSAGR